MLDPLLEQLLPGFVEEAEGICERVTRAIIELERAPGPAFDELARGLHTLKGSAATLGLSELSELAHAMEDAALPMRGEALPRRLAGDLLAGLDLFVAYLRSVAAQGEAPRLQWPPTEYISQSSTQYTQAEIAPTAAAGVGGAISTEGDGDGPGPLPDSPAHPFDRSGDRAEASFRIGLSQVAALTRDVERLREVRLRIDDRKREVDRALPRVRDPEARAQLESVRRSMSADVLEAADIVASLEEGLKSVATLPLATVTAPLRRAVRDLCAATGKEARLAVSGAEVSLDRRVLEQLRGPLVHLVRNAVDHGIESPRVRESRGKHREGAVTLRVEQQGNMLFLEISDDGDGLDLERIRAKARDVPGAASMTPQQLAQLIFRPGFTTRDEVSQVSGRGIGLDAVEEAVHALHGSIEVQSKPGQGTRFLLSLPADLGSSPILIVRAGEHQIGVPLAAVESSRLARRSELQIERKRAQLHFRDELLPVSSLGALLGLHEEEPPEEGAPLLVMQTQSKRLALAVDEVLGDRELVIRPLPPEVRDLPAWQGAATLARGELLLILRPEFLATAEPPLRKGRRALVVDDSLTARALHRTSLEAGGFSVHTARGGAQALEQLRHDAYDVLICDIGMEAMDGFELARRVRGQGVTTPILLVSARDTASDRARGLEAGASGFLTKKDCVSGRLLSEVLALLKEESRR